jgi:hypothetical protein
MEDGIFDTKIAIALKTGFEEVNREHTDEGLSNDDLAVKEEHIREELESSHEEVVPVRALRMKLMSQAFQLIES